MRVSFALTGLFGEDTIRKPKPKNVVKLSEDQTRNYEGNKDLFYRSLNRSLREEAIFIQGAELNEREVSVAVASSKYMSFSRIAGRSARIVSALSPESIETINLHVMNGDFEIALVSVDKRKP